LARTALLVDDDPLVLAVVKDMLEDLGCEVLTAASAREALDQLSSNRAIALLITDINMPQMDGVELAKRAEQIRNDVKTMLISGRQDKTDGFPVLHKPFDQSALRRIMERTVGLC
jgi:two-component system, cell cycle response regulator CpdR